MAPSHFAPGILPQIKGLLYTAVYNPQEYTTRTPAFDPKILEKMDFVLTAPQIQHSKGRCVSTTNKKPTLQTLFFTLDVITSSNYAYLSLQTHQLSAISAVSGNRFTIVKLQFKCHVVVSGIQPEKAQLPKPGRVRHS